MTDDRIMKGDIVICVSDSDVEDLITIGKEYDVLYSIYGNWIQVINDHGEEHVYDSKLFVKSKEETAYKLPPGTTAKKLDGKAHLVCFDPHLENEMGLGMRKGADKHGWNNHRKLTAESAQQIMDSVKRHLNAYLRGERNDTELQISHLACVVNNINFIYRLDRIHGYEEVIKSIYGETK